LLLKVEAGAVAGEFGRVEIGDWVSSASTREERVGSSRTLVTERNDLSWKDSEDLDGL
jgi:hypothetical protein